MLVQHLSSAKAISAAGIPSPGMIPAEPKLSLRVIMANRKPSREPAGQHGAGTASTGAVRDAVLSVVILLRC
jgi:hypothetical protein